MELLQAQGIKSKQARGTKSYVFTIYDFYGGR